MKFKDINWAEKLSSRKFWESLAGIFTSIAVICGADDSKIQMGLGIIGMLGSMAIFIWGEAKVDAAKAVANSKGGISNE